MSIDLSAIQNARIINSFLNTISALTCFIYIVRRCKLNGNVKK